ncbi:MAG: 23S rRNA (guanosine(2251)-2'-O)-methyltransferase RlmB [Alphaproteobacteria bacterium]|nr:23S rRNA (guanosine(2251)-2'-O)-methyltransferase RlmB [Alphaproteobacteria bacterium]
MYLYGYHPCRMALSNPMRKIQRVLLSQEATLDKLPPVGQAKVEIMDRHHLERLLPAGAVHQGIVLDVHPLEPHPIEFLEDALSPNERIVVLDQVNDPHNVGAILRTSAVFGARALVMTDRHAPKESGALAKSACGALELVPRCVVNNLAQSIKELKAFGFWFVGFSEAGEKTLDQIDLNGRIALLMGGEGEGMRRLTKDLCDFHVRLATVPDFSTLNVSNAAAIALYETFNHQNKGR